MDRTTYSRDLPGFGRVAWIWSLCRLNRLYSRLAWLARVLNAVGLAGWRQK